MNKKAIAVIIGIVLFSLWYIERASAIRSAEKAVEAIYEAAYQKKVLEAQRASNSLLEASIADEREKHEELSNIISRQQSIIDGLQQRPTRSQFNSAVAEARKSCTGAELYREDGEFLTREAARADRIKEERNFYYEQYERARQALESFQRAAP